MPAMFHPGVNHRSTGTEHENKVHVLHDPLPLSHPSTPRVAVMLLWSASCDLSLPASGTNTLRVVNAASDYTICNHTVHGRLHISIMVEENDNKHDGIG